jgi:hypothetical protein
VAAKAKGVQLGEVRRTNAKDPAAVRAVELRAEGRTCQEVADQLNAEGYVTGRGNAWATGNTYTMLRRVATRLVDETADRGNECTGGGHGAENAA